MSCVRKGCQHHATHYLVARVWAQGYPKTSAPITCVLGLHLCRDHARETARTRDVITDDFWSSLDRITAAKRVMPVDRGSLELVTKRGNPADEFAATGQPWRPH